MELVTREASVAASRQKNGIQVFEVADGQRIRIETSPGGAEILDVVKPAGVAWNVQIQVTINEVDV